MTAALGWGALAASSLVIGALLGLPGFLVMLIDSMIPEAVREGGDISGLVTVLGFSIAAALSGIHLSAGCA